MKDPLFSNKIAGAVLAALILIFGLPQLTGAVMGGGHGGGHGGELHLAYCCVELEANDQAAADEPAPVDFGTLLASASIAGGERTAAGRCKSCHTLEEGGADGTGPNLWNIVNRNVAGVSGFNYTSALQAAGGVWSYERLDEYLKNSQAYVPGTAMAQRFPKDNQRANILAYLGSLSADPVAYPQPAAVVEAPTEAALEASGHDATPADHAGETIESAATAITDGADETLVETADVVEDGVAEIEEVLQPEE